MEILVKELLEQKNVRSNLSEIRKIIKDESKRDILENLLDGSEDVIVSFLKSDDAKTRKNAALLLGDLEWNSALPELMEAYDKENTLFVRSSYLMALLKLDVSSKVDYFEARLKELTNGDIPTENRKHIDEEIRCLRKIIIKYKGISRHKFSYGNTMREILLFTNRNQREVVRRSIDFAEAKVHPLGVLVKTDDIEKIKKIRTYRELVFPLGIKGLISGEPKKAANQLWDSDMYSILSELHTGGDTFYYRIDCKSMMSLEERSEFSKKLANELDNISNGSMVNSPGDYEVEIKLIATKEGNFFPCLKLNTLKDDRFLYRKNFISASINPSTAALIMELSAPYLKEKAQVIDPFCGVGTMLIERDKKLKLREIYGTDIFGEAIEKARENSKLAGLNANYIHRDFFDFKHDYKFDEIITNMPVRGKKTKEEIDSLYENFFRKSKEILVKNGIIIMYTNELGLVRKYLRLNKDMKLLQETCMQKDFYLQIIRV